jgi:hypothetical protein
MPYQKKLPMSSALRPGGEGVVPPAKGGDAFNLGSIKGPKNIPKPSGPTKIGKGVPAMASGGGVKAVKAVSMPKMPQMIKSPGFPKSPKSPRFK